MSTIGAYFMNILVAFDQFVNTIFGGPPDETISARWGKGKSQIDEAGADVLNAIEPGHTEGAIVHDEERAEHVISILSKPEQQKPPTSG